MLFSDNEMSAALKAGHAMVEADGKIDPNEIEILFDGLSENNLDARQREIFSRNADRMQYAEMIGILSAMEDEKKRYIAGYLASIMVSDGDIDKMEVRLWKLISSMCQFPRMTVRQAIDFWANN